MTFHIISGHTIDCVNCLIITETEPKCVINVKIEKNYKRGDDITQLVMPMI
jgi:hypothetical protein